MRPARLLAPLRTPRGFARLSLVSLIGLWVIVPSGTLVRLTGSGLGCPDAPPFCDGNRVVPELSGHALIEFSNRILSGLVAATAVLAYLAARRLARPSAGLRRWALPPALATVAQVPIGAVTVAYDLHPALVSVHFLVSMLALAGGVVLWLRARDAAAGRERRWDRRRGPLAIGVALSLGVALVTGVLVTAAGPHSGDQGVVQRFGDLGDAAYLHVRAAVTFVALAAVLIAWLWREGGLDALTGRLALVALPLAVAQIAIGEYQFRQGLPWQVVAVHVSLAALLWAVVVGVAWGVARRERVAGPAGAGAPAPIAPAPVGAAPG